MSKERIAFIKSVLPGHYTVQRGKILHSIHCASKTGIPETGQGDKKWESFMGAIKKKYGKKFQEIFHETCTNHSDFIVIIKP